MSRRRSIPTRVLGPALAVLGVAVLAAPALASGTYRGRPASPPASIDRSAYELGKKIYAGQFTPGADAPPADAQRARLEALQERLPMRARTDVDLPSYAGKLDDEQLAALEYFLKKRFKVE